MRQKEQNIFNGKRTAYCITVIIYEIYPIKMNETAKNVMFYK